MSEQIINHIANQQLKKNLPQIKAGDTVKVHYRIKENNKERVQVFEGLVIATKGSKGIAASFTVRRIASGVGVERTFPLNSPWIAKIERIKSGKVRRAKLYFVRRHAASPRKFRLKDTGVAGVSWEEIGSTAEDVTEETADEAEATEETAAPVEETETKEDDQTTPDAGGDGRDASQSVPDSKGTEDSGA